jgi:hypothetical protein
MGFPYEFPFVLPGAGGSGGAAITGISPIASSAAVAFPKLATYLKTNVNTPKPNVQAILQVFCNRFDEVEVALQGLYFYRQLANAYGILLDNIGAIVGLPRKGLLDPLYQAYLYAQIASNNSSGTTEDLNLIFRFIVAGIDAVQATAGLSPSGITWQVVWQNTASQGASFMIYVTDPNGVMTQDYANAMNYFTQEAKGAAIRGIVEYSILEPDANLFSFMSATDTFDGSGSGPTGSGVGFDQGFFRGAVD